MPNVASVLKSEIARLSGKAVREHVAPIRSATNTHRKQLADLKRQLHQLQRQVAQLQKVTAKAAPQVPADASTKFRFTAKGLRTLRRRLDLSAQEFGQLVQVGGQTIYSWEAEKSSPRPKQLPAIVELRKIGKREARARLDQLKSG